MTETDLIPPAPHPIHISVRAGALLELLQLAERAVKGQKFIADVREQVRLASAEQADAELVLELTIRGGRGET